MTSSRAPLSTEAAFDLVVGVLTVDAAAARIGRQPPYIRAISNPADTQRLAMDDAIALDLAYAADAPGHYPLFESYRLRLQLAEQTAIRDSVELGRHAARCLRESSDGCVALVEASLPGADDRAIEHAIRELEESRGAEAEGIGALREVLRRRRGPPEASDTS